MSKIILVYTCLYSSVAFVPVPSSSSLALRTSFVSHKSQTNFQLQVATSGSNFKKERLKEKLTKDEFLTKRDKVGDNPLAQFSEKYQELQKDYYLQMAFLQAGVLASCADMTTQTMEAVSIDFGHVAAMAIVASTMSGLMNAVWLKQLEAAFPGTETKHVAYKTLIHAIIIASIINSAYLAFVPLLTTYIFNSTGGAIDFTNIFSGWSIDEFITLTKLEILMFIPYNTLAFKFVPPSVRPLTHAIISATFNVAVSAVTLGYFDKWCENAVHIFS